MIFDNGDILFDASLWRKWLAQQLQQQGVAITYEQLVQTWEAKLVDVYRGKADYWIRFREMLDDLGLGAADAQRLEDRSREQGQTFQSQRRPMPGVPETLVHLRQLGIKLAVLSDTESGETGVRKILTQLGIEPHFHAVVASRDLGVAKPSAAAYQAAIDRLGVEKPLCAFVGHDLDELQGAMDCGLLAIAYNYDANVPADHYIDRFDQLIELVCAPAERPAS